MMSIRNPRFTADGRIDLEIDIPGLGWAPFTASADDVEDHGRSVYQAAMALGPAPYVEPEPGPNPVPQSVTRLQAKAAILMAGRLADVEAVIAASDPMTRLAWAEASEFQRASPTIATWAAAIGMTDAEIDDLFRAAALITF